MGLLGFGVTNAEAESTDESSQPLSKPMLTIDLARCEAGQQGFAWGLGSVQVTVRGLSNDECVFELTDESEGGYTVKECRVPAMEGQVTIEEVCQWDVGDFGQRCGVEYSFDFLDCRELKSGNIWTDLLEP
jgi:hypothetical protein